MIDFNRLVMRPAVRSFGRPITYTPTVSQPNVAAFSASGIYDETPIDIPLEGDSNFSSENITLGIRLEDFAVAPLQGDRLNIPAYKSMPALGDFLVDDLDTDGQGGGVLTLKKVSAG